MLAHATQYLGVEAELVKLPGSFTNDVFKATVGNHSFIVREFGKDALFDRVRVTRISEQLSVLGMGPKVLARFTEGTIEEFVDAPALNSELMLKQPYRARIANRMAEFHSLQVEDDPTPDIWRNLEKWMTPSMKNEVEWASLFVKERMHLSDITNVVFCHNDLFGGNILWKDDVTFIDFEYSSYNYAAFDIANLFCGVVESSFSQDIVVPPPTIEEKRNFIKEYFKTQEINVDHALCVIEAFELLADLRWILWAQRKGEHAYALKRMQCYFSKKLLCI